MTFEVGKYYRTRDGRKAQCIWCDTKVVFYKHAFGLCNGWLVIVTDDGTYCHGQESPVDIIGPWIDAPDPGEGWRLLGDDEVIQDGDEFKLRLSPDSEWSKCQSSVGSTPARFDASSGAEVFVRRRIEPVKKWRPFANAEEFRPFRDRWWRYKFDERNTASSGWTRPPAAYSDLSHDGKTWEKRFEECVFEDGTPFGVEVSE